MSVSDFNTVGWTERSRLSRGEVDVVDRKAVRSLGSKINMCADPLGGSPGDQTTSRGWIHADVADVRCPSRKSLLRTESSISMAVQYE